MRTVPLSTLLSHPKHAERLEAALVQVLTDSSYDPKYMLSLPSIDGMPTLWFSELTSWFLKLPDDVAQRIRNEPVLPPDV